MGTKTSFPVCPFEWWQAKTVGKGQTLNSSHGHIFQDMKLKFGTKVGPFLVSNISKIQTSGPTWDRPRLIKVQTIHLLHSRTIVQLYEPIF